MFTSSSASTSRSASKRRDAPVHGEGVERAPKHGKRVRFSRGPTQERDEQAGSEGEADLEDEDLDLDTDEEAEMGDNDWERMAETQEELISREGDGSDPDPKAIVEECRERIKAEIYRMRSPATRAHWAQVERDWLSFSKAKFRGDDSITPDKVLPFFEQAVLGRARRTRQKQGTSTPATPNPIGIATVKKYISGINNIWVDQGAEGRPPISREVKGLIEKYHHETDKRRRESYVDRGKDGYLDGLHTLADYKKLASHGMEKGKAEGLRDRAMLLLNHAAMLRGQNARGLELSDCSIITLEHEGLSQCNPMIIVLTNGKTNRFGKKELMGLIRHGEVDVCPVGAMALYWFHRFHVEQQALPSAKAETPHFPNLTTSADWYDLKVFVKHKSGKALPASNATESLTLEAHAAAVKRMYRSLGLHFSKVTHLGRSSGAKMAELAGASIEEIRQGGRWDQSVLNNHYLNALPLASMRALAGFDSKGGKYYVPRLQITPPEELARQIFPEADEWLDKVTHGKDGATPNLGAQGWLKLLLEMRTILLQDSLELMDHFPSHPVWQHAPFNTAAYKTWAGKAKANLRQASLITPESERLRHLVPDVHKVLMASNGAQASMGMTIYAEQKAAHLTLQKLLHAQVEQGRAMQHVLQRQDLQEQRMEFMMRYMVQQFDQVARQQGQLTQHFGHIAQYISNVSNGDEQMLRGLPSSSGTEGARGIEGLAHSDDTEGARAIEAPALSALPPAWPLSSSSRPLRLPLPAPSPLLLAAPPASAGDFRGHIVGADGRSHGAYVPSQHPTLVVQSQPLAWPAPPALASAAPPAATIELSEDHAHVRSHAIAASHANASSYAIATSPASVSGQTTAMGHANATTTFAGAHFAGALQALEDNINAHSPLIQTISVPRLSRSVSTATDAWIEWDAGLLGAPPFKTIYTPDHKFTKGKEEAAEKKFWSRRQPIIRKIEELAKRGNQSPLVIAQAMDAWLDSKDKTLRALSDSIKNKEYEHVA